MRWWMPNCADERSTALPRSRLVSVSFEVHMPSPHRRDADLCEKLVLSVLRLAFPLSLERFMGSYRWKWIFEPSTNTGKSIAWLLFQALD